MSGREPIRRITSRTVALPAADIDTDQIIPARFLTTTSRTGLGKHLFSGWRYAEDGSPRADFALNDPSSDGASILIAGDNFGCGSSREHAAWALLDYGIRAVISTTIADIFRSNAQKNGIVPVVVPADVHARLLAAAGAEVTIDVEAETLTMGQERLCEFELEPFARTCLLKGVDQLGYLLEQQAAITEYEKRCAH